MKKVDPFKLLKVGMPRYLNQKFGRLMTTLPSKCNCKCKCNKRYQLNQILSDSVELE